MTPSSSMRSFLLFDAFSSGQSLPLGVLGVWQFSSRFSSLFNPSVLDISRCDTSIIEIRSNFVVVNYCAV